MKDVNINKARAIYYNMFANFFIGPSDMKSYLELLRVIENLKAQSLDKGSQEAFENLFSKLGKDSNIKFLSEFDEIFHNPQSYNIRTTASFYDEGIESGKKRVEMLNFLAKTKIRRDEKKFYEYEDSVGFIFAVMSELIELTIDGKNEYENTIHCIYEQILNEFVDEIINEIYTHPKADIYKDLMVVLNTFVEFERLYLDVSKPAPKDKEEKIACSNEPEISEEEKERRARNKALKALGPKEDVCPTDVAYDVETEV